MYQDNLYYAWRASKDAVHPDLRDRNVSPPLVDPQERVEVPGSLQRTAPQAQQQMG